MRLAVFTSKYPARIATFFERDMRSLVEAGIELEVFSIAPLNAGAWKHSLDLLAPEHLPRERVHHLTLGTALQQSGTTLRRSFVPALRDALAVLGAALPYGPMRFAKTAYLTPKAWTWAAEFAGRYDHVLGYWGNYAATCAYLFHRLAAPQVPFSMWLHAGTDLYRGPLFMRDKLRYADNIITCCEFNQKYIRRCYGDVPGLEAKLHVFHHGLNLADFPHNTDGLGRAPNRLLAVGKISAPKGFDYLLRAAQQLRTRGVDLVVEIIGDGEALPALRALATELGLGDRAEFRGWQSFAGVREAMQRATVLVHPSSGLGDGLPNVIREAMALGTPVVASAVAGIPDALSGGCGILVPPKDPATLASAIEGLLRDPEERRAIAARARRRTEDKYDLWRNGARLAQLLRSTRRTRSEMAA